MALRDEGFVPSTARFHRSHLEGLLTRRGHSSTSTVAQIVSRYEETISRGQIRGYEIRRRSAEGQAKVRRTSLARRLART